MSTQPQRRVLGGKRTVLLVLMVSSMMLLAGACGSPEPPAAGYSRENRDAFMAACTDTESDALIVSDLCECVFDQVRGEIPLKELDRLDQRLRLDSLASPPEDVFKFVADCFVNVHLEDD